jgi:hypothetical protein
MVIALITGESARQAMLTLRPSLAVIEVTLPSHPATTSLL